MLFGIMFWLGCLRFGKERTIKRYGHPLKEVGIYARLWNPLMLIICVLIAIGLLLMNLKHTLVEWIIDTKNELKDNEPLLYMQRRINITMTHKEFYQLTVQVRKAQKKYYSASPLDPRKRALLNEAKRLEKALDDEIERVEQVINQRNNPTLDL